MADAVTETKNFAQRMAGRAYRAFKAVAIPAGVLALSTTAAAATGGTSLTLDATMGASDSIAAIGTAVGQGLHHNLEAAASIFPSPP